MASCSYHSPQFSEDIAWLPAWLQPHQPPAFGDGAKDENTISGLSCKAALSKNISNGQHNQLFTKSDAKYSGCHLYLSGDDNSLAGSIPSSEELLQTGANDFGTYFSRCETEQGFMFHRLHLPPGVCQKKLYRLVGSPTKAIPIAPMDLIHALHFRLHVSSLGICELSTSELNEMPQQANHETNEGSLEKHFHEFPAVQDGTIYQYKVEDEAPESESPLRNKLKMSHKRISRSLIKADQKSKLRLQGKPDAGSICNADVNDAVELSIAASEAMVISDMVANSLQSENLPAATILEITLRVKQARYECSLDILEAVSSFPADELGENDLLSDLDENTMADAFGDVGISLTQIVESTDNSHFSRKPLQSNPSCDLNTHTLESHFVIKEDAQSSKLKTQDTIVNGGTSQTHGAVAIGSISKHLPLQPLPVQQTKPSAFVPLDCLKSCLKSQPKVDAQNFQENTESLIPNQTGHKEDEGIQKDGKVSSMGNAIMRRSTRVLNRETSFISESMDEMDERTVEHIAEAETEIVASSSAPSRDLSRCPYREFERSIHEGCGLSQDLIRSSGSSLIDPLCSVVPCSISMEDAPISCDPYKEVTKCDGEKFMEPNRAVSSKELNGKNKLADVQETTFKLLAEGSPVLFENIVEIPAVPRRKQFNSLRHYSTLVPDAINYKPIPSQSIAKQTLQFSPAESSKEAEISSKSIGRCADVDGSKDYHSCGGKDQEKVRGPSTVGEAKDDDSGLLIHHHEDIRQPVILNNRKRHLGACQKVLNSDSEEENIEGPSSSKIKKHKIANSTNDAKCSDPTNLASHVALQSSLRTHLSDKQSAKNKRVWFSEAKSRIDKTNSSSRLQSKQRTHGSHHRSRKRVKESTLPNKSVSRKGNYNYLTCQHIVYEKEMIFQGLEFLLTGFPCRKEKELEALIRQSGGYVLLNIPSNPPDIRGKKRGGLARLTLPIVLSPKKVQTTKFLYGCATDTWMLNAHWLVDSVHAGSLLPPWKYMTRLIQGSELNQLRIGEPFCLNNHNFIFEGVGIMLNGKVSFCTKFSKIIKHGGGCVFKSLQRLVQSLKNGMNTLGAVLVENEGNVSRHLKQCALENNLRTVPASWIVNSLFSGKLLPFKKDRYAPLNRIKMPTFSIPQDDDMSEEI